MPWKFNETSILAFHSSIIPKVSNSCWGFRLTFVLGIVLNVWLIFLFFSKESLVEKLYARLCKKSSDSCVALLDVQISLAKYYSSFSFENIKIPWKFNETNILAFHSSIISKDSLKSIPWFSTSLCFRKFSQQVADIFFPRKASWRNPMHGFLIC